jgi:Peptidase family M28
MTDKQVRRDGTESTAMTKSAFGRSTGAWVAAMVVAFGADAVSARAQAPAPAPAPASSKPEQTRLRAVVEKLAAPEFAGRSGAGGERAAEYLVDRFRALKLQPLFGHEYLQPIPGTEEGTVQGRNVGAMLRGRDPALREEWVILAAHFDHLGVRRGQLYPGADDNASGVAMMLEVARSMTELRPPPKRSMMFIGFDLEEVGLYGSRYFVAHPPVPLEKVLLFVTADMIGRSLAGVCDPHVFAIGTEHSPGVRPWIDQAGRGRPLKVCLLGADLLVLNRSDYGPFRSKSIPFLFFTTGENPRYHTPEDTPETLDYPKLTAISQMIGGVIDQAMDAPLVPRWQNNPDHPFAEAVAIHDVLGILSQNGDKLKIGGPQRFLINNTLSTLSGIVARGTITPEERSRVIQAARVILFTVL